MSDDTIGFIACMGLLTLGCIRHFIHCINNESANIEFRLSRLFRELATRPVFLEASQPSLLRWVSTCLSDVVALNNPTSSIEVILSSALVEYSQLGGVDVLSKECSANLCHELAFVLDSSGQSHRDICRGATSVTK